MPFRPSVDFQLSIGRKTYRFTEHPAAKGMPYGQTGRRATVYQVVDETDSRYALKVFTPAFRSSRIADAAARLQTFAQTPGLGVCAREVLTRERYAALIEKYPDLQYSVLMPWVHGETWQELFVSQRPVPKDSARTLAGQMTVLMANMEQCGLAHCDIAGPNVMVDLPALSGSVSTVVSALYLVDVEEMYGPGLSRPDKLPAGTPGYNHKTSVKGLWSADSDRFAGAVMLAEMLTRHDERVRRVSFQEQYFDPGEMQQSTDRYRLAVYVLQEQGDTLAADLFSRAWFSQTLSECPTFSEWFVALNRPQFSQHVTITSSTESTASVPVGGWRGLNTSSGRISNPPVVTVPMEQIRPMLQKATDEGRWPDVLLLASQILQVAPADPEAMGLQTKAQRLVQLEQAIQSLWQVAVLSGSVEDWENCIRTITTAQYQAKNLERYEQLRQDAEKEHQVSIRVAALEQLIHEKHWDEAKTFCGNLPLEHPRVAELLARIDMEISNELRLGQLIADAQKAAEVRSWMDTLRFCREGLVLSANNPELKKLLDLAQKEHVLDQQVAESLRLVGEASAIGQWMDAEKYLRQAIQLQPQRQNLHVKLDEVIRNRQWAEQIERVFAELGQKPADELLDRLENIPAGFGKVDEACLVLNNVITWRANLEVLQSQFDLKSIEGLLLNPPDSRVSAPEMEAWLRVEQARESNLEDAFRRIDIQAVEMISSSLHQDHPLKMRCQSWLADVHKTTDELDAAQKAFDAERIQIILGQVAATFPRYSELTEWANTALEAQKVLVEARSSHNLPVVEQLLAELPFEHPAREGTQVWLESEKNRHVAVKEARNAYDLDRLSDLLNHIPEDAVAFKDDWHWLKVQQQMARNVQNALDNFDVDLLAELIEALPLNYPYREKLETWWEQENVLRVNIQKAQNTYDLEEAQKLIDSLSARHPLRAGVDAWLAKHWQLAADLQKARQDWDFERALTLLDSVSPDYPNAMALRDWGVEARERRQLADELTDRLELDGLEKLLATWPQDDPRLKNRQIVLANMRKKQQELAHLLADAESALAAQEWQKATQLCQTAFREPKVSLRFGEIVEIARLELEKRDAAEKLMLGAQEALFQKRYAEAIWQADQAAALLPGVQPYARAGRDVREKLMNMAREAEKNHKWNDAKSLWAVLKSAPTSAASATARSEPVTAPRETKPDALAAARTALKAGQFEKALELSTKANLPLLTRGTFINEIQEVVRNQAQAAQNAGKWERAKELWELLKKVKKAGGR